MCSLALTENYARDRRGFRGRRVDLSRALPAVCLEVNPASGVESEHVVLFLFTHFVHAVVHSCEKFFWHMGTGTRLSVARLSVHSIPLSIYTGYWFMEREQPAPYSPCPTLNPSPRKAGVRK